LSSGGKIVAPRFETFATISALSGQSPHCNNLSAFGQERTTVGFWPKTFCPLMTRQRHWLCTAAMVLMPVSAPINMPV